MTKLGEGFTSVFATAEHGPIVDRLRDLGIPSYVLGEKGFLGAAYIARFLNILGAERIDLLHLNTLTSFCKYAAIAGALRRLPLVWVVREDPLISRSRRLRPWLRLLATRIVFVDHDTKRTLLPHGPDAEVIPNGVDTDTFRPYPSDYLRRSLHIDPDRRLIGYVGSITPRKGVEHLINALPLVKRSFSDAKLIVIGPEATGNGSYSADVRALVAHHRLQRDVYFTGPLSDMPAVLNSLDLVVLPSLDERCSRTLLEALACGKAVVATRVGGTPEIVRDGVDGILVPPRDPRSLAEALLRVLTDDALRHGMGMNGRDRAVASFGMAPQIGKMRSLYLGLKD
jgi:glycosyltransferase involved in cell wall biosynthesis